MSTTVPADLAHLPVCPHRDLPIPYIAETGADGVGHFTIFDSDRAAECLAHRLCAMCGKPMGAEVALIGDEVSLEPGGMFIEPPVHEHHAELALGGLCPFLSRERVPRRPPDDGVVFVGAGRDTITEVGRSIPKRPVIMAITRTYRQVHMIGDTGGPVPVYQAGRIERVRRYAWADGRLAEVTAPACPVAAAPPRPAVPRVQPRRQSRRQRRSG